MGKRCWMASLAIQLLFPIQILLIFLRFDLPPNFIFECYRPQTWQFYLVFPAYESFALAVRREGKEMSLSRGTPCMSC